MYLAEKKGNCERLPKLQKECSCTKKKKQEYFKKTKDLGKIFQ